MSGLVKVDKAVALARTNDAGDTGDAIVIGSYQSNDPERNGNEAARPPAYPHLIVDAPELEPHAHRPWFQAHLHERYDIPLPAPAPDLLKALPRPEVDETCRIPADLLRFHALLCGATGSGKTRLALHLLYEQLCRGGSLVALDPKEETLWHLAHLARKAGIEAHDITVLLPRHQGVGCPGWNPLDYHALGVPCHEAVAEFVRLIEESSPSWGARLADVLKNAARLAAYHKLSLYEMVALLRQQDYRDALLEQEPPRFADFTHADRAAYAETHDYFAREFSRWSGARQAEAVDPVLNKVRSLLDSPFLRSLLCATHSTLDLSSLWHRPRVVLIHLDFRALGSDGTRLLAGLLSYNLFQTALRVGTGSSVSVTLSLDEMGIQERFVGGAMRDILALARSYNLRLMSACQHLGQLSPELREALLTVAFKAFFRLGPNDARPAAGFLCDGTDRQPAEGTTATTGTTGAGTATRLLIDLPRRGKYDPPVLERCCHRLTDPWNRPIAVSPLTWAEFEPFQLVPDNAPQKLVAFRMLVASVPRVYVVSPISNQAIELFDYLAGVDPRDFDFGGPSPVSLVVRFPRPKVTVLARQSGGGSGYGNGYGERESGAMRERRWEQRLLHLGEREAVVSTPADGARCVRVREVVLPVVVMHPGGGVDWSRFLSDTGGKTGQSQGEVEAAWSGRRQAMERVLAQAQEDATPPVYAPVASKASAAPGAVAGRQPRAGKQRATQPPADRTRPTGRTRTAVSVPESKPPRQEQRVSLSLPPEPEVADDGSL